jgi:four helix bundle protein
MRKFQDLVVWQKSHQLTLSLYQLSQSFPHDELYGLVSQIRRSSSSVPTNIAEGCGRDSDAEMKRFLTIASGSVSELEYQLLLAKDLNYLNEDIFQEFQNQLIEIRKMLYAFIKRLNK